MTAVESEGAVQPPPPPAPRSWGVRDQRGAPAPAATTALGRAAWVPPSADDTAPVGHGLGAFVAGSGWVANAHPDKVRWKRMPSNRRKRPALMPFGILGRVVISATVGLILFGAFGYHSWITNILHGSHHLTTPKAVAGAPQMSRGHLGAVAQTIASGAHAGSGVHDVVVSYYGSGSDALPQYFVAAFTHSGSSLTGSDLTTLVDKLAGGQYTAGITSDTRNGVKYSCGSYAYGTGATAINGVACLWDDYDVVGMVISFEDANTDRMLNTAQQVRDSAEA